MGTENRKGQQCQAQEQRPQALAGAQPALGCISRSSLCLVGERKGCFARDQEGFWRLGHGWVSR